MVLSIIYLFLFYLKIGNISVLNIQKKSPIFYCPEILIGNLTLGVAGVELNFKGDYTLKERHRLTARNIFKYNFSNHHQRQLN